MVFLFGSLPIQDSIYSQQNQHSFEIDAQEREQLMLGLDPIGVTLAHSSEIDTFIAEDSKRRPWIWLPNL